MSLKSFGARLFAWSIHRKNQKWIKDPVGAQLRVFRSLIGSAANTQFGKDHGFGTIQDPADFVRAVPVRDYEALRPWVDRMVAGEPDMLWPGKPTYLAKTSGTTSGTKYIPLTRESLPNQITAARDALLAYGRLSGNFNWVNGKMIFLQGSPALEQKNGIHVGRLSGIVAHFVPSYLQKNRMPSWETNCIEDWETKVDAIVEETVKENMTLISGIPPWVQNYFEKLLEKTGKRNVLEVFPNFALFVTGGVAYEPYRAKLEQLMGKAIPKVEVYPASEGFIAYQDQYNQEGLLLLTDGGIFYEFIPADQFFEENPPRLTVAEVELGVNYAIILSTNAGLWAYNIGDTVEFVSLFPHRIRVTGRIKHFISAFGEHVIGSEVEDAMQMALQSVPARIAEFTVAPQVAPAEGGAAYHEWFIEFDAEPDQLDAFAEALDRALRTKNSYYNDLRTGEMLRTAVVRVMQKNGFNQYMQSIGKLGGQNKLPRLSNDRKLADGLGPFTQA